MLDMDQLRLRYDAHVNRCRARHETLDRYECPNLNCGFLIYSRRPPKCKTWDVFTLCPACGQGHFKTHRDDGSVVAVVPPEAG